MRESYWTKHEAAEAWQVSLQYAQNLMAEVPGSKKVKLGGRVTWIIPTGSKNPRRA